MNRPPRNSKDGIFSGGLGVDVVYQGVLVTVITIVAYLIGASIEFGAGWFETLRAAGESGLGMTMAFLAMSMCEIFHSFNLRSQRKSVFSLHTHNKILWAAMLGSLLLTTLVIEVPFIANAFGFTPIGLLEYGIAIGLAILVIPVVELVKLVQRTLAK
jgi:Ca2+-transporting ATPase